MTPQQANGSIYNEATALTLFADVKARRVGDVLTVRLAEQTDASTSASTNTDRTSSTSISNPVLSGEPVTRDGGIPVFQSSLDSRTNLRAAATARRATGWTAISA